MSETDVEYKLSWESISPFTAAAIEQQNGSGVWGRLSESEWLSLPWQSATNNITDDPWDQYQTLKEWAESHEQPIRNVQLAKRSANEFVHINSDG